MSRAQGVHGSGSREYTVAQARSVRAALSSMPTTIEELANRAGVGGRTVRSILSDIDGRDLLLADDPAGVFVVEYADDANAMTRRLRSQAIRMLDRAGRRRIYAASLPRRQPGMFDQGKE